MRRTEGASHVSIQPVNSSGAFGDLNRDALEKLDPWNYQN